MFLPDRYVKNGTSGAPSLTKVCNAKCGLLTDRFSGNKINLPTGSVHAK